MSIKINILGDSILKGVVYDKNSSRYKSTAVTKCSIYSDLGYEIKNMSRLGLTAQRAYDKKLHLKDLDCDYLILALGGNDSDYNWKEVAETPNEYHSPNTEHLQYKETLTKMVKELKEENVNLIMLTFPPISSEKYFEYITKNNDEKKILEWMKDKNLIYRNQEGYSSIAKNIAREENIKMIDIREEMLFNKDYYKFIGDDGIHLNSEGYDYLISLIAKEIKTLKTA